MINLNPPIVDTRVIDNFLSNTEVESILLEASIRDSINAVDLTYSENKLECKIIPILDDPVMKNSDLLLREKMHKEFGADLIIGGMHILESHTPYRTHIDGIYGEYGIDDDHYGAYTVVIPLETVDSNTVIFNEWYATSKNIDEYIQKADPIDSIDDETYEKYLSYELREKMRYLSIETVFPWKTGSLLAASRYKWHCSDNYLKNGIESKTAVIMWCTLPYKSK
jgi:hypothetical protein